MAQATVENKKGSKRVDSAMRAVRMEAEFLPEWEAMWAEMDIHQRLDLVVDWKHLMVDYLPEVDAIYHSGAMTEEQVAAYPGLLAVLREKLPILERLELENPPVFLVL